MALTKLTKNLIDGTFGTEWDSTIQTSNFTAVAGKGYFVNTTSGQITVTLPAGLVGNEIIIQDYAGTFATNKVIFAANGSEKIQGSTDNYQCTIENATVTLIYQDATKGWTSQDISLVPPPLTVDYLVVAGGGSGGSNIGSGYAGSGGGGAGGLRTSYGSTSGGGASAESSLNLSTATNYTVTVGASGSEQTQGNPSTFSTITSTGGGFGGKQAGYAAGDGGSGGGANAWDANANDPGIGTSDQGYDGGSSVPSVDDGAGGGGGAAAVGSNSNVINGGNGGNGLSVSITGSSVTYAGGGGGAGYSTGTGGSGGSGGGGNGGGSNQSPTNGAVNTGGGGGGAWASSTASRPGGSGVVILRYSSSYTITVPAGLTSTTATDGSDKVTTFTVGTGNIQFN